MNLENTNKLVINKKTCEELFLLCYKGDEMARIIIKRMAKKKRAKGTIVMQISAFATFSQNANARILSKPVFIQGYSWRILAIRFHLTGYWLLVRDFLRKIYLFVSSSSSTFKVNSRRSDSFFNVKASNYMPTGVAQPTPS